MIRRKSPKSLAAIGGMLSIPSAVIATRGASRAVVRCHGASPRIAARFDQAFVRRTRLAEACTGSSGEP